MMSLFGDGFHITNTAKHLLDGLLWAAGILIENNDGWDHSRTFPTLKTHQYTVVIDDG